MQQKTLVNKVENKIPDINNLTTKTSLSTVVDKIPDISSLVKKSGYNAKITSVENNVKKLQVYDLSYFTEKQYFDEGDGKQNYLVFLSMSKYFKLNTIVGVLMIVFYHGNLKDYLIKVLNHLKHLITVLIQD